MSVAVVGCGVGDPLIKHASYLCYYVLDEPHSGAGDRISLYQVGLVNGMRAS